MESAVVFGEMWQLPRLKSGEEVHKNFMKKYRELFGKILILVIIFSILSVSLYRAPTLDLKWNTALGAYLAHHGGISKVSPSYLITQSWYNPTWFAQLLWYGISQILNEQSLFGQPLFEEWAWLLLLFFAGTIILLQYPLKKSSLIATLLWISTTYPFWQLNIGIFAIFCGLMFYHILWHLERSKQANHTPTLIALLFIQIVWINCHASGILGIISFFVFSTSGSQRRWYLCWLFLATQISPYSILWWGNHLAQFPIIVGIGDYCWWNYWFLLAGYCCKVWQSNYFQYPHHRLVGIWFIVSCIWPMWAIPTAYVMIHDIMLVTQPTFFGLWLAKFPKLRIGGLLIASLPVILAQLNIFTFCKPPDDYSNHQQCFVNVSNAYKEYATIGLVAHDPELAPYLLQTTPKQRIFWDNYQQYAKKLAEEWSIFRLQPSTSESMLVRWNIATLIINHQQPGSELWLDWLARHREWALVYCDDVSSIFLNSNHPNTHPFLNRTIIDQSSCNPDLMLISCKICYAKYLTKIAKISSKQTTKNAVTNDDPQKNFIAHTQQTTTSQTTNIVPLSAELDLSCIHYRQALFQRSQAYLALRLVQRSQSDLELIRQLFGENYQYWLGVAKIARSQGNWKQAIENLSKSWQEQPTPESLAYLIEANLRLGTPEGLEQARQWEKQSYLWIPITSGDGEPILTNNHQTLSATTNAEQKALASQHQTHWFELLLLRLQLAQVRYLSQDKKQCCEILELIIKDYPAQQESKKFLEQVQIELQNSTIQEDLEKAKNLIQQLQYEQAFQQLHKILSVDPNYLSAQIELGKLHLALKEYQDAAEIFQKILDVSPNHLLAQTKWIIAISHLGKWKTGREKLAPLLTAYPDRYEVREALFEVDQTALLDLQKRLTSQFSYEDLQITCEIFTRHQKFVDAIIVWQKFQKLIPPQFQQDSQTRLAKLYYEQGKYLLNEKHPIQAQTWLEQSLILDPNLFECHLLLGTLALRRNDWDQADKHFQTMQKIAPLDIRGAEGIALIELGRGLNSQLAGQYQEAIVRFEEYEKKAPEGQDKENIRVWIQNLRRVNQELLAKTTLNQTAQAMKNKFDEAALAMKQENWEQAVSLWNEILVLDPHLEEAKFNRGLCHYKLQHWPEAIQDWKSILENNPNSSDVHLNLGNIYYRSQQYDEAKKHWERYLELSPQGKDAVIVRQWLSLMQK